MCKNTKASLPWPNEWRVVNESLADACRRLYPHIVECRQALIDAEGDVGAIVRAPNELEAYDGFLAACRAAGLDR